MQIPAFPFNGFPDELKRLIQVSMEHLNFPPEITTAGILSAVSISIGNSLVFKTPIPGFDAKAILWLCVVAPRGSRKSPAINKSMSPVLSYTDKQHAQYKERLKQWEANGEKSNRPSFYPTVINDSTMEGVLKACDKNPHGILTLADELDVLTGNFGRYSRGSDMPGYNSLWNGATTSHNRKNAALNMYVQNPFWTLIGGLQPTRLADQFGQSMIESGFLDRMQFVFPNSLDYQNLTSNPPKELVEGWEWYNSRMSQLIEQAHNSVSTYIRAEDPDIWINHYNVLGNCGNGLDEADPKRGLVVKAQVAYARLSLIAHGISVAFNGKEWLENLTVEEGRQASLMAHYFMETGIYAYNKIAQTSPLDTLPLNKRLLYESLPADMEVSKADIKYTNETLDQRNKKYQPIPNRTLDRFLADKNFFKRGVYGKYLRIW